MRPLTTESGIPINGHPPPDQELSNHGTGPDVAEDFVPLVSSPVCCSRIPRPEYSSSRGHAGRYNYAYVVRGRLDAPNTFPGRRARRTATMAAPTPRVVLGQCQFSQASRRRADGHFHAGSDDLALRPGEAAPEQPLERCPRRGAAPGEAVRSHVHRRPNPAVPTSRRVDSQRARPEPAYMQGDALTRHLLTIPRGFESRVSTLSGRFGPSAHGRYAVSGLSPVNPCRPE
jgi:hypothetical protein